MPDCLPSAVGAQIWGAGPLAGALSAARGQERGKGPAPLSPLEDLGLCKCARAQPAAPQSARHRLKCEFACSVSSPALACCPTGFWNLGRGSRTLHVKPCRTIPQPRLTFSACRLGPPSLLAPGPQQRFLLATRRSQMQRQKELVAASLPSLQSHARQP